MSNELLKDQVPAHLADILGEENLIKVYPYEMVNAGVERQFIKQNTTSIVYISQNNLKNAATTENEFDSQLSIDSQGDAYFEMYSSIVSNTLLDTTTSTSVFGKVLEEEDSFTAVSNWFYEGQLLNVQNPVIGEQRYLPVVFTVGKPFDKAAFEADKQAVFIATNITEARESVKSNANIMNPEGLYEFNLINSKAISSQFSNCDLLFNNSFDPKGDLFLTQDGTRNGIILGFENHTLINFIKGKGKLTQHLPTGFYTEYNDIDFVSNRPLAPLMMTPISTQDKIEMYVPWFDYDIVLPYVIINLFKNGSKLDIFTDGTAVVRNANGDITNGGTSSNAKTPLFFDISDLRMIQDMIAVSAGFASSWSDVPVLTSGGDAGKIKPDFRVGWSGMKVSAIAGKDPIKVVDGIYENHIRKHPAFLTNITRYQPVKAIINALSRYIYSSYAVGKGQNSFNQVYLPWFLEPKTSIKADNKVENVQNPDIGGTGNVTIYTLPDSIEFSAKTTYFRTNHTSNEDLKPTNELVLPRKVDVSNTVLIQTDRKLTLPKISDIITPIDKLTLPGDIDTRTSNDLMYLWHLPINSQLIMEELFLNALIGHTSVQPGQEVTVTIPAEVGVVGKYFTQAQANALVLQQQPGIIKSEPSVHNDGPSYTTSIRSRGRSLYWNNKYLVDAYNEVQRLSGGNIQTTGFNHRYSDTELQELVVRALHVFDREAVVIESNNNFRVDDNPLLGTRFLGSFRFKITHAEFGDAVVIASGAGLAQTYSYEKRPTIYDKQSWKAFLSKFNIIPNGPTYFRLLEKDNFLIKELDEIIIGSCWGNWVSIVSNGIEVQRVKLFNRQDETIGVQRILFT